MMSSMIDQAINDQKLLIKWYMVENQRPLLLVPQDPALVCGCGYITGILYVHRLCGCGHAGVCSAPGYLSTGTSKQPERLQPGSMSPDPHLLPLVVNYVVFNHTHILSDKPERLKFIDDVITDLPSLFLHPGAVAGSGAAGVRQRGCGGGAQGRGPGARRLPQGRGGVLRGCQPGAEAR